MQGISCIGLASDGERAPNSQMGDRMVTGRKPNSPVERELVERRERDRGWVVLARLSKWEPKRETWEAVWDGQETSNVFY